MEYDVWSSIAAEFGSPSDSEEALPATIERFRDRLPRKILDFWRDHGWGSWNNGCLWMCDPTPFDAILGDLFEGDPKYNAENMTVVAYTAVNDLRIWDRRGHTMLVNLRVSDCFAQPPSALTDPETSKPFSHDFLVGMMIKNAIENPRSLYQRATRRWGPVGRGEVFAFVPALQLGGENSVENLIKVSALEHMSFLSQLEPLKLTRLTPSSPDKPLARLIHGSVHEKQAGVASVFGVA